MPGGPNGGSGVGWGLLCVALLLLIKIAFYLSNGKGTISDGIGEEGLESGGAARGAGSPFGTRAPGTMLDVAMRPKLALWLAAPGGVLSEVYPVLF